MNDPKEFANTSDNPENNGWGNDIWPEGKSEPEEETEPENNEECQ